MWYSQLSDLKMSVGVNKHCIDSDTRAAAFFMRYMLLILSLIAV